MLFSDKRKKSDELDEMGSRMRKLRNIVASNGATLADYCTRMSANYYAPAPNTIC